MSEVRALASREPWATWDGSVDSVNSATFLPLTTFETRLAVAMSAWWGIDGYTAITLVLDWRFGIDPAHAMVEPAAAVLRDEIREQSGDGH